MSSNTKQQTTEQIQKLPKDKDRFYHLSYNEHICYFDVDMEPQKAWDYDYLFLKNVYPAVGKDPRTIKFWIKSIPMEKVNFERIGYTDEQIHILYMKYQFCPGFLKNESIHKIPQDKLNFKNLSLHPELEIHWLSWYPNGDWDLVSVLNNFNMFNKGEEFFKITELVSKPWNWSDIKFPTSFVSLDNYLNILKKEWHLENYSTTLITEEWMEHIPETPEVYYYLSFNPGLNYNMLMKKRNAPWHIPTLFKNRRRNNKWLLAIKSDIWPFNQITDWDNITQELLEAYPDANWNYDNLSSYQGIKLDWLKVAPRANWNFQKLCRNFSFNLNWLLEFPNAPWDFNYISGNCSVDISWLQNFPDAPWNYEKLSQNVYLSLYWIEQFPDKPWNYELIAKRSFHAINFEWHERLPHIPWQDITTIKNLIEIPKWIKAFPNKEWDYYSLMKHQKFIEDRNLTLEVLELIPEDKIDFSAISKCYNMGLSWLQKYPNKDWDYTHLSKLPELNEKWLEEFPDKPWDFQGNYFYINIFKLEWIDKYPNIKWDYSKISLNSKITVEYLLQNQDKPWNYKLMSLNSNLNLKILETFRDKAWNYNDIIHHPKFDINWIKRLPDFNADLFYLIKKFKNVHMVTLYQYQRPEQALLSQIDYDIDIKYMVPLCLLNKENKINMRNNTKLQEILGFWSDEDLELTEDEKLNVLKLAENKYNFCKLNPNLIRNMSHDLELQDLTGDIYSIPNWFDSDNLLRHIYSIYPNLEEANIIITDEKNKYNDFYATNFNTYEFKERLSRMEGHPQAMIVYLDETELENRKSFQTQKDDDEMDYFEMWNEI